METPERESAQATTRSISTRIPPVHDETLIASAQVAEHYEIAEYGTLKPWARVLGKREAIQLIEWTLEEEKQADDMLTWVAGRLNFEAATPHACQLEVRGSRTSVRSLLRGSDDPACYVMATVMHHGETGGITVKALSWINFILGLWLIVAGFALSAGAGAIMAEEIVLGIIIALLAIGSVSSTNPGIAWCVAIAGLWTLIAPAVINYTMHAASRTNDIVVGIIVLVLGFANAVYRQSPARTHA